MRPRIATIILTAAIALILGIAAIIWQSDPEPQFKGKGISWYVSQVNSPEGTNSTHEFLVAQEAGEALRQMGPSAVTWLAARIERRENITGRCYRAAWQILPAFARQHVPRPAPAVGAQSYDLLDRNILEALIRVGPDATPVLTNYLASKYEGNTRYQVYIALARVGSDFADAIPMLEHNLTLTNAMDRVTVPLVIARVAPSRVAESVSLLRTVLVSGEYRARAADHLAWLGVDAKPAVPDLEAAYNDSDPKIRDSARSALQRITGRHFPKK